MLRQRKTHLMQIYYKRGYGMKRKIISLFLGSIIISCAVCGCEKNDISESTSDAAISTTENAVTSSPAETTEELTTEPQTEVQAEFDFVKTIESTYICGQRLSYPLTWGQFWEDFSIDYESAFVDSEKQTISAYVRYKGYDVGIFGFTGCDSVDSINDETLIRNLSALSNDSEYFGMEKIVVNDLSLGIDHSQLFNVLGDDYREGVGYQQIIYENDIGKYFFTFSPAEDEDKLITVNIYSNDAVISTTESAVTSAAAETTEKLTTEPQTEAQSEFDFVKTIESTYICGQKLSYPLTWGQFGEDFSIDTEGASFSKKTGNLSCYVNYKGQCLGIFSFKDCENVDSITSDTSIYMILIQNMDMEKFDVPKININGLKLHDTHENVHEALGDSCIISDNTNDITYCDNSNRQFSFGFSVRENEDKLISVRIIFN